MSAYLETRTYKTDFPVTAFYRQNNTFRAHWHVEVEMVYVCSGSITVSINKETRILSKGEMAIIRSSDIHYYDSTNLSSGIIVLIFRPELIGSPGGWPDGLRFCPPFIDNEAMQKLPVSIRNSIGQIFRQIAEEIKELKPHHQQFITGKIYELSATCLRFFPTCSEKTEGKGRILPDIQSMQSVIRYLEQNYMHNITLADVAGIASLSQYYFSRLFGKYTGLTFKAYLNKLRVDHAERQIKSSKKTILEIALECGFDSIRTFNRVYKSVKGYPPSRIRL